MIAKPLLAPIDSPASNPKFWSKVHYPLLLSPKLDGIRGIAQKGVVYSRSMKPIPSNQVQSEFRGIMGLDGELMEGNISDFDVYNRTQSSVMAFDQPGNISYNVFDCIDPDFISKPFYMRLEEATRRVASQKGYYAVPHAEANNYQELLEYEDARLAEGFEGIMMRDPVGRYKQNRGTMNEGIIFKLKRFEDTEGVVLDIIQGQTNNNVKERDERGYAKRSYAKEGMVLAETAGAFIVSWNGIALRVAMGAFKHHEREEIWKNRDKYIGQLLKYRFFLHGIKDLPRFPRALGWRNKIDM